MVNSFRCVIHGSFSKFFSEINQARKIFTSAGIKVLAPKDGELISDKDGFKLFADEQHSDPRLIELLYLHNLKKTWAWWLQLFY